MNREKGSIKHLEVISGNKIVRALEACIRYADGIQDEAMEISE